MRPGALLTRRAAPLGPARFVRCPLLDLVEVLRSGFHGVDDQLIAVVVDQGNEFEQPACRVGADHEPAAWIVFIIERARVQDVRSRVEHGCIIEPVAPIVPASGLVQVRQHVPIRAPRLGSRLSAW